MEFLRRLDMEILIGQLSFKQRAEIFNSVIVQPLLIWGGKIVFLMRD